MAVNNGYISIIRNDRLLIPEKDFSTKAEIQACVIGTVMKLPNCLYFKALISDVQFCLDVDFFFLCFIFLEFLLVFQYKKGHLITILEISLPKTALELAVDDFSNKMSTNFRS